MAKFTGDIYWSGPQEASGPDPECELEDKDDYCEGEVLRCDRTCLARACPRHSLEFTYVDKATGKRHEGRVCVDHAESLAETMGFGCLLSLMWPEMFASKAEEEEVAA